LLIKDRPEVMELFQIILHSFWCLRIESRMVIIDGYTREINLCTGMTSWRREHGIPTKLSEASEKIRTEPKSGKLSAHNKGHLGLGYSIRTHFGPQTSQAALLLTGGGSPA